MHHRMYFNSRPSARGDFRRTSLLSQPSLFQFTPLREGRPGRTRGVCARSNFNSRPSARGDGIATIRRALASDFNSRPSARGDGLVPENRRTQHISIHAPPRGATSFAFQHFLRCCISIHAPPRGATSPSILSINFWIFQFTPLREGRPEIRWTGKRLQHFNSRPSARGDPRRAHHVGADEQISIHAPPRGATL